MHSGGEVSDDDRKGYLVSQLKGTAALWLEGLNEEWIGWDFNQLV